MQTFFYFSTFLVFVFNCCWLYVTIVPVEDRLDEDDLFGTGTLAKDIQPREVVKEDHDLEDVVPISISLGKSPR